MVIGCEQYMALPYPLEIIPDSDEGGFVGSYPDLPGCLTCGLGMVIGWQPGLRKV